MTSDPEVTQTETEETPDPGSETQSPTPTAPQPVPGRFTLRYDPKSTLNPITALNRDNILISALLYESLFVLDGNLNVEPLLCESWETEDNVSFTFNIKPGIAMSDGSRLTADDVVYTLRQASLKGRFINRFGSVTGVSSDGELAVTVTLQSPNSRFIYLLDVPVIKSGSIDNRLPPGTGPYTFTDPDVMRLDRFTGYRDFRSLPLTTVYLLECGDDELTQLFDDGELSLLWDDPSDAFDIRLNRLDEKRYYNTTTIQFIGFNAREGVMRNPDVRRAVGCSIDRNYIVNEIMSGQAIPAPLPLPATFRHYDPKWEHRDLDPLTEMSLLLDRARMEDFDNDSYLEIADGLGGYADFSVDFIVNSENMHRARAANAIADNLRQFGFRISVRELPWESFINALQLGDFDMYYGEITLGADFDLSPLVLPGNLNFGGTASTTNKPFIDDFLASETDEEVQDAVSRLLDEIQRNAPFVPVLYKKYVIHTSMGAISGAEPGQSNVFRNFTDWKINLSMLS